MKNVLILLFLLPLSLFAQRESIVSQDYLIQQVDTLFMLRQVTVTESGVPNVYDTTLTTLRIGEDSTTILSGLFTENYNTLLEYSGKVREANSFFRYFQVYNTYKGLFASLGVDMDVVLTQNLAPQFVGTYRIRGVQDTVNYLADLTIHPNPATTNRLRIQERGGNRAYNVAIYPGQIMALLNYYPEREGAARNLYFMYSGIDTDNGANVFKHPSSVVMPTIFGGINEVIAVKINR